SRRARAAEVARAGGRAQLTADDLVVDLVCARFVARGVEGDPAPLRDPADEAVLTHADERPELLLADGEALLGEHADRGLGDERLREHEDAVHAKDHAAHPCTLANRTGAPKRPRP